MSEPVARNPFTGEVETKLQFENSLRRMGVEVHHRFEAANPGHHTALRKRSAAVGEALDRGDVQAARAAHRDLEDYLDGIDPSALPEGDDEQSEHDKARRSRGNRPVVDHPEGDAPSTYEQNTRARIRKLNAEFARWTA